MHFFLGAFVFVLGIDAQEYPCPEVLSVDLSDGTVNSNNTITKDGILFDGRHFFRDENNQLRGCPCNLRPCFRKCCGPNEIMVGRNCTETNHTLVLDVHEGTMPRTDTTHHRVHNKVCKHGQTLLLPHMVEEDQFYLQVNGSLFLPMYQDRPLRNPEEYCLEIFDFEEAEMKNVISGLLCITDEEEEADIEEKKTTVHKVGMIISIPFLLATFIAYALLPDRNLHMKALMFYVINLMMGYIILISIQLSESRFEDSTCAVLGYFCLFFFLVSFFWMNVICVDIWFTFSGLRGFSGSKKVAERKRFFTYCAYAWGVPVVHVIIVYLIDRFSSVSAWYNPGIGTGQCFLKRGYAELLYFHGPMAILITINIIMFAITAIKIRNIKKDTSMLKKGDSKRHSYENDKQTFNLYLKLLFGMGVNWSMEIISWAVGWAGKAPDAIWYLTDFCNAIYGVFIFFIFVFKKNIWKLLKKRYYSLIGRPHLGHSMTMTNTTRVTSYSTTNSTVTDNPHGINDTSTLASEA